MGTVMAATIVHVSAVGEAHMSSQKPIGLRSSPVDAAIAAAISGVSAVGSAAAVTKWAEPSCIPAMPADSCTEPPDAARTHNMLSANAANKQNARCEQRVANSVADTDMQRRYPTPPRLPPKSRGALGASGQRRPRVA